jgi:ribosome-associated heat shock protein Hsp15
LDNLRIDKWLWAARFFKTRSLACDELQKNRVHINGNAAKPSREVKVGDTVQLRQGVVERTVVVRAISAQRANATAAQTLYEETEASLQARTLAAAQRRLTPEPAHSIEQGRPTKRDRRQLEQEWDNRWSASID